jgi:hypothetical protein
MLLFIAIIFGKISHKIMITGVIIAIDMKWPYCLKKTSIILVSIADDIRFTKRFPIRIVIRIFSGLCIKPETAFSLRFLDIEKR